MFDLTRYGPIHLFLKTIQSSCNCAESSTCHWLLVWYWYGINKMIFILLPWPKTLVKGLYCRTQSLFIWGKSYRNSGSISLQVIYQLLLCSSGLIFYLSKHHWFQLHTWNPYCKGHWRSSFNTSIFWQMLPQLFFFFFFFAKPIVP